MKEGEDAEDAEDAEDGMGDAQVGVVESGRTCGWLVLLWVYGWIRVPESVELSPFLPVSPLKNIKNQ